MLSRYDAVLSALNAGVVIHAADTEILEANERARELLGLQHLEGRLATDPQWAFLEADRSPMTLPRFPVMQVIASGAPLRGLSMIIQPPDGPEVWLEVSALPLVDDAGQLDQVVVTFIDVTARRLAEAALSEAAQESRQAFDLSRVATCLVANDGRLMRVNQACCDLFDRSEEELLSLGFLDLTHPEDISVGAAEVAELLAGTRTSLRAKKRYITGKGRVIWGDVTVSAVRDPDGRIRHRIAQILDVTEEHDLQTALMEAERIGHMGAWQLDVETGHVIWSRALFEMFGLDPAGPAPDYAEQSRLFTPESWESLSSAVSQTGVTGIPYEIELEIIRPDGAHGWIEARGEALRDANGEIVALHGMSLDVTERKTARDALQVLASHDPLTGLANRAALLEEMARALSSGRRSGRTTAILMMDLDRFKDVNDTLGHAAGDDLLVATAARLEEVVRGGDLVSRLGGDEFVVVMRDLDDPREAARAAERVVHAFQKPFDLNGREVFTTASVGVTVATETAAPGDLLREADTAMYAAKSSGRDRMSLFNEDLRTAVADRVAVEADLRRALDGDQFEVWYQPEVDLETGAVVALEALLRWRHPDGTIWSADQFVDVAEDTGLMLDIGDWVLRQACLHGATWVAERPDRPMTMRVNTSTMQLAEAGLLTALDGALNASGLDPHRLCIEFSETALLHQTARVIENLAGMHERGVSLAIDDFGTGYASLTYLDQFRIDVIKIDRSFVPNGGDDHRGLVGAIITMATALGIGVTAEGVEHPDQAALLRRLGSPSAQGWLYSPAVGPDQVPCLLDRVFAHS